MISLIKIRFSHVFEMCEKHWHAHLTVRQVFVLSIEEQKDGVKYGSNIIKII